MPVVSWKYAKNQFLRVTDGRRPLMLLIAADHWAKLLASVGSPADVDIQACLDRLQPLYDNFQLRMVTFDVVSGTRKGQTEVLVDLLKELRGLRIKQWDITIQNTFLSGTPQYTQIMPDGREPFQAGAQDMRILAVQTLAQRLSPFSQLAALKTTVETFHASLVAARDTQQGTEGQITAASTAAEAARVALAIGLMANVGRLMEKFAAEPHRLAEFFEIALLRAPGSPPPPSPTLPTFAYNWTISGPNVVLWFQMPAGVQNVSNIFLREGAVIMMTNVTIQPGQTQQVTWANVAIEDEIDEVVLRNAQNTNLARGVFDSTLPQPGM